MISWGHVDPTGVTEEFRQALQATLEPLPDLWLVTHGFRSTAEQAALYAKYKAGGPRAAPPGLSPHEYGMAIDVALDIDGKMGGQVTWNTEAEPFKGAWGRLWAAVDASAILHSGRYFHDPDHIERTKWHDHVEH